MMHDRRARRGVFTCLAERGLLPARRPIRDTPPPASTAELAAALARGRRRQWAQVLLALAALVAAILASASLGVQSLGVERTLRALFAPWLPASWVGDLSAVQIAIVRNLRLPRTVMAVVAGAGLSAAGVGMQGITRNPLVSPYTLGLSPAAGFGASLAILAGVSTIPTWGHYWTVAAAFTAAVVCAATVLGMAAARGVSAMMLILGGVALTYFFAALTATVQFVATDQQLAVIIHWTFGSLNGTTWDEVAIAGVIVAATLPVLHGQAWALNAFAGGGDDVVTALGFAPGRTRLIVTAAAVLATAAIVSFTGVIAFVGLVAPHIARLIIGGDHRVLVPYAALVGAVLLLLADMAGRLVFAPVIIPVGIVVAYLGVPLFLHLLLSKRDD